MNCNASRLILWLAATAVLAAAAVAQQRPPIDPGERILNSACMGCHELRSIETTALDREGWTKLVDSMIQKGAVVKQEDVPALVKYLTSNYGPLPEGPGKAILLNICTQCHTLERVKVRGGDRESWNELLSHMLNEGAPLSDEDYPILLGYLARNFR
ncbi:MAG TPA: hypothetical protein VFR18_09765 [Terriglobia bacterium]|nr:hypothetical protein [Terriglobia bacterium]